MAGRSSRRCNAWARSKGRPCIAAGIGAGGRCFIHGGVSRLRTPEGVARAAEAVVAFYADWRSQHGLPSNWRYRRVRMSAARWLALEALKAAQSVESAPHSATNE
jgi:hypothetical protein